MSNRSIPMHTNRRKSRLYAFFAIAFLLVVALFADADSQKGDGISMDLATRDERAIPPALKRAVSAPATTSSLARSRSSFSLGRSRGGRADSVNTQSRSMGLGVEPITASVDEEAGLDTGGWDALLSPVEAPVTSTSVKKEETQVVGARSPPTKRLLRRLMSLRPKPKGDMPTHRRIPSLHVTADIEGGVASVGSPVPRLRAPATEEEATVVEEVAPKKRVRGLALDGGGARGIISALMLREILKYARAIAGKDDLQVVDLFDVFSGTSIGGLTIMFNLIQDDKGKIRPLDELISRLRTDGPRIFQKKHTVMSGVRDLHGPMYNSTPKSRYFKEVMGERWTVADAVKPFVMPAFDIGAHVPMVISSRVAATDNDANFPAWMAGDGATAAPTFWGSVPMRSVSGRVFETIDGGMIGNNPSQMLISEMIANGYDVSPGQVTLVSLGTGEAIRVKANPRETRKAGKLYWASTAPQVMMEGTAAMAHHMLDSIYGATGHYHRLQPKLDPANAKLDGDPVYFEAVAQAYIRENKARFQEIARQLVVDGGLLNEGASHERADTPESVISEAATERRVA